MTATNTPAQGEKRLEKAIAEIWGLQPGTTDDPTRRWYAATGMDKTQRVEKTVSLIESSNTQLLDKFLRDITKQAITTLDTSPVGVDKIKSIPIGAFVRLRDVKAIIESIRKEMQ